MCLVLGLVIDGATNAPIAGASVLLENYDSPPLLIIGRSSSDDGAFAMTVPACEAGVLRVERLGYEDTSSDLDLDGPGNYSVTLRLVRRPMELAPLEVLVRRSARLESTGFYARKAWVESTGQDLADFYDPEEVSERRLANVPEYVRWSRIRFVYGGCEPSVYVDGRLIRHRPRMNYWNLVDQQVSPNEVEGMEIYRSISTAVPVEFRDEVSMLCGAVLVWTKAAP